MSEIKPVAISIAWLKASVSQNKILLNTKCLKFHRNFMERFGVGLKTFLGLAVPNQ